MSIENFSDVASAINRLKSNNIYGINLGGEYFMLLNRSQDGVICSSTYSK